MDRTNQHYVYALFDYNGIIRWVGAGKGNRINDHRNEVNSKNKLLYNNRKIEFVRKTVEMLGDLPRVKLFENLTQQEAFELEILFIKIIGKYPLGPLTNLADGGPGPKGIVHSLEYRRAQSKRLTGKKRQNTDNYKNTALERWQDPKRMEQHIKLHKGKKRSAETCLKMSLAKKGKKQSAESNARRSATPKGKKPSEESLRKRAATFQRKKAKESLKFLIENLDIGPFM